MNAIAGLRQLHSHLELKIRPSKVDHLVFKFQPYSQSLDLPDEPARDKRSSLFAKVSTMKKKS
jgi:hypothetical protein